MQPHGVCSFHGAVDPPPPLFDIQTRRNAPRMQYLLLIFDDPAELTALDPPSGRRVRADYRRIHQRHPAERPFPRRERRRAGDDGDHHPDPAREARHGRRRCAATKEHLAGYYVVEACRPRRGDHTRGASPVGPVRRRRGPPGHAGALSVGRFRGGGASFLRSRGRWSPAHRARRCTTSGEFEDEHRIRAARCGRGRYLGAAGIGFAAAALVRATVAVFSDGVVASCLRPSLNSPVVIRCGCA